MPIRLVVNIEIPEENLSTYLPLVNELVEKSQKEEGCIQYQYFIHPTDKTKMVLVELWESEAALTAHEHTEHFTRLIPLTSKLGKMVIEKNTPMQ